ncbi:MAG: hypothetical protein ACRC76_14290, partial [Proteocatella sp.]
FTQYISDKSRRKIKDKVKTTLARNTLYEDLEDKIDELNLKVVGWKNCKYSVNPSIMIKKGLLFLGTTKSPDLQFFLK